MNSFAKIDRQTFLRFAAEHPEQRYELERGRIVQQMTGCTARHGVVALSIAQQFLVQLALAKWRVTLDRGIGIGSSSRYPDVVVEPTTEPLDSLETECPAIIVEVLSPSTTATDLNSKPSEYLSLASLDAYIVASQDEAAMLVWTCDAQGTFPTSGLEVEGLDKAVVINGRGLSATLNLADIYRGIVASGAGS